MTQMNGYRNNVLKRKVLPSHFGPKSGADLRFAGQTTRTEVACSARCACLLPAYAGTNYTAW